MSELFKEKAVSAPSRKEFKLEKQLSKINKQMFSLPDLVWENDYHVDEEATALVCPEYVRLVVKYDELATELNKLKHARLGLPDLKQREDKKY